MRAQLMFSVLVLIVIALSISLTATSLFGHIFITLIRTPQLESSRLQSIYALINKGAISYTDGRLIAG